jgi:hypothetical protein
MSFTFGELRYLFARQHWPSVTKADSQVYVSDVFVIYFIEAV